MNYIAYVICLLAIFYFTQLEGAIKLTENDKAVLSKLYELSKYQRRKTKDMVIEYYKSKDPDDLQELNFYKPNFEFYKLHMPFKCHELNPKAENKKINNYILLPEYPTKETISELSQMAKNCPNPNFQSLVVGYKAKPNEEDKIDEDKLAVIPVPMCINNPQIDAELKNNLKQLVKKFEIYIPEEKKQYAILYYGDIKNVNGPDGNLFENKNKFIVNGNKWMVAIPSKGKTVHSEHSLLKEIKTKIDTKINAPINLYLFTKHSPCINCATEIVEFAKAYKDKYESLAVFYHSEWIDCFQSSEFLKKEVNGNLKLSYFQLN